VRLWLVHVREDIRTENGLAFSVANAHVGNGCATIGLHDAAVLIFKDRNPKRAYSVTLGMSSSPPASSNRTLTAGGSARRLATTDPEEPDPQITKSYCVFRLDVSFR